jgi:hypothetical protein
VLPVTSSVGRSRLAPGPPLPIRPAAGSIRGTTYVALGKNGRGISLILTQSNLCRSGWFRSGPREASRGFQSKSRWHRSRSSCGVRAGSSASAMVRFEHPSRLFSAIMATLTLGDRGVARVQSLGAADGLCSCTRTKCFAVLPASRRNGSPRGRAYWALARPCLSAECRSSLPAGDQQHRGQVIELDRSSTSFFVGPAAAGGYSDQRRTGRGLIPLALSCSEAPEVRRTACSATFGLTTALPRAAGG